MKMSKHSSCLIHRNFLVGISYSDATPGQSFAYDHLGQLTQITDVVGTRTFAYNLYGEPETDSLAANGIAWQVSERYDGLGRQAGDEISADDGPAAPSSRRTCPMTAKAASPPSRRKAWKRPSPGLTPNREGLWNNSPTPTA